MQPWVTKTKIGVFMDPRHLGFPVNFRWIERGERHIDSLLDEFGVRRPGGWDLLVWGAATYDPESEIIYCGDCSLVTLRIKEFEERDNVFPSDDSSAPDTSGRDVSDDDTSDEGVLDRDPDPDDAHDRSRSPRRRSQANDGGNVEDITCWDEDCDWTMCQAHNQSGSITLPLVPTTASAQSTNWSHDADFRDDLLLVTTLETAKARDPSAGKCVLNAAFSAISFEMKPEISLADHIGPPCFDLDASATELPDGFEDICALCRPWYNFAPQCEIEHWPLHQHTRDALWLTAERLAFDPGANWKVQIYTDGSATKDGAAWAAAFVFQAEGQTAFGGVMGSALAKTHPRGSLCLTNVTPWKLNNLVWRGPSFGCYSGCRLYRRIAPLSFGLTMSLLALEQVGTCDLRAAPTWRVPQEASCKCWRAFDPAVSASRMSGHVGHPWNELADTAARSLARGHNRGIPAPPNEVAVRAAKLDWKWAWVQTSMDVRRQFPPMDRNFFRWTRTHQACRLKPEQLIPVQGRTSEKGRLCLLKLKAASANVQGLNGKHKYLEDQMIDMGYDVIMLQETKTKGGSCTSQHTLRLAGPS